MYFCNQDHTNYLVFNRNIIHKYGEEKDPNNRKTILLDLDLHQKVKRYRRKPQKEYLENLLKNYIERLQNVSKVEEFILQIDLRYCESDDILSSIFKFIQEQIVYRFKNSITKLSIYKCNFSYLLQQEHDSDPIEKYILDLIGNFKNLKYLGVVDLMAERDLSQHSTCQRFSNLVKEKIEIFKDIQELELGFIHEFEHILTKKQYPQLISFIIDLLRSLKNLESLNKLKLITNNLELSSEIFQKMSQEIIQIPKLKSIQLDFSQENQKLASFVQSIQTIQKINDRLEEFEYKQYFLEGFDSLNIHLFTDELSKLKNLKSLSLKNFKLKKGGTENLFQAIIKLKQLENLNLDMSDFDAKNQEIQDSFEILNESKLELKSFDISYPHSLKVSTENTSFLFKFLEIQKEHLEQFQLTLTSIQSESFIQFLVFIEQIKQLKKFGMFFQNKARLLKNKIVFTVDGPDQKNIFEYKTFTFCDKNHRENSSYFNQNQLAASYFLKYQNPSILKNLLLNNRSDKTKYLEQVKQNLECSNSFTNLESIHIIKYEIPLMLKLIENNSKSLLNLQINQELIKDQFKILFSCKNLIYLSIQLFSTLNVQSLRTFCEELPNLQNLRIQNGYYYFNQNFNFEQKNGLDCSEFVYSQYITDVLIQSASFNKQFLQLVRERKVTILQNIVYQKLIQQFLLYKSSQNFWDLYY